MGQVHAIWATSAGKKQGLGILLPVFKSGIRWLSYNTTEKNFKGVVLTKAHVWREGAGEVGGLRVQLFT